VSPERSYLIRSRLGTSSSYWSKLNGDGEIVWGPDPKLTTLGEEQAQSVNREWKIESKYGLSVPPTRLVSPMTRAMQTCRLTFNGVRTESTVVIVENCREEYGEHTCDKRRSKTWISTTYPEFIFEEGFTEEDELWTTERESHAHCATRAKSVLDMIFDTDKNDFISIIAHGGIINGFLATTGRMRYALPTGGVLPLVIKSVLA